MDPVTEALQKTLEDARARYHEASEARKLAEQLPALHDEVRGLELALARRNGSAQPTETDWTALPRSQAILRVLQESNRPLGPAEIRDVLDRKGRTNDKTQYISSTLDSLKKRGKVASLGQGRGWTLSEETEGGGL